MIFSAVEVKVYIPLFILSENHVCSSKDTKTYSSLHRENITEIGYHIFTEMVVKIRWEKGAKGDWLFNKKKYEFCDCDICNLDLYTYQIKINILPASSFYLCLFRLCSFFLFFFSLILSYTIVFFSTLSIPSTNPSLRERWVYIRIRIN